MERDELDGNIVKFSAANARYLQKVLRLRRGDHVGVFDGKHEFLVELSEVSRANVVGCVIRNRSGMRVEGIEIIVGFACIRPGPVEKILRHGTELGVHRFVPILTTRASRRPEHSKPRWHTIIASAIGQSGRSCLPEVEAPITLEDFLTRRHGDSSGILLSTSPSALPLLVVLDRERPQQVVLLIGPEGGLDESEELQAVREGFHRASLGPATLRTETAAVVAAGVVAAWHESRMQISVT